MKKIKSVCIFCGASNEVDKKYLDEGKNVGKLLADNYIHMVFGAGNCGLMGSTACSVLENKGTVTGVFPTILDGLEVEHKDLTETIIVEDMHTRKMIMFEKSDAFIILPGGFGTMDETFEIITWKQLHTHDKPIIIYNFDGYWDHWVSLTEHFIKKKFASEDTRDLYKVVSSHEEILKILGR